MDLILYPEGILKGKRWDSDEREWREYDVTDKALFHLMDKCELAEGVTLRDVCLLVKQDLDVYKIIVNNWVEDFIDEAFREPKGQEKEIAIDNEPLDYLELYWMLEIDERYGGVPLAAFPSFHGIGWSEEEQGPTQWGVEFMPMCLIIDLPLKINDTVTLCEEGTGDARKKYTPPFVREFKGAYCTLMQIIYGIFWEMSFFGSPIKRDEIKQNIVEDIENLNPDDLVEINDEWFENLKKEESNDNI